jgi:hypothetical protein
MNEEKIQQNKKWWQLKSEGKYNYGRIALLSFLLVGLKSAVQIPLNPVWDIVVGLIDIVGIISGIFWLVGVFKKKN